MGLFFRGMRYIYQVYQSASYLSQQKNIPIHLFRNHSLSAISLLASLQLDNNTLNGVLSGVLLDYFNLCSISIPKDLEFSSSFYLPGNILKYSKLCISSDKDLFICLASSFNCYDAWILRSSPHFIDICISHCIITPFIDELLRLVKHLLQNKDTKAATKLLEHGRRFDSPVIYRLLSRMYLQSSPSLALVHSRKAIELGDIESKDILASLVDDPTIPKSVHCGQISNNRLQLICHMLFRLDPVFVKKVQESTHVQHLKFTTFISGNLNS